MCTPFLRVLTEFILFQRFWKYSRAQFENIYRLMLPIFHSFLIFPPFPFFLFLPFTSLLWKLPKSSWNHTPPRACAETTKKKLVRVFSYLFCLCPGCVTAVPPRGRERVRDRDGGCEPGGGGPPHHRHCRHQAAARQQVLADISVLSFKWKQQCCGSGSTSWNHETDPVLVRVAHII